MKKNAFVFILALILLIPALSVVAASGPIKIGEHDSSRSLQTPHPYPGSKSGKPEAVWTDIYEHKGAKYIVVEFKVFELENGDWVEVSDLKGGQVQVFRGLGFLEKGGDFITKMIFGDAVKITLYSSSAKPQCFGYLIDRVTRGYNDEELSRLYGSLPEPEAVCGTNDQKDAVCYESSYPEIYETARSVCRIVMDGSALCTGWLVSCENHLITNNHCTWDDTDFDTQAELNRMEFQFMYEDPSCGGSSPSYEYSFMGGTWLENHHNLDYTLIQAPTGEDPAATYGWVKFDLRVPDLDELIYIVGHPSGRPKEISLESSDPSDPTGFAEIYTLTADVCVGGTHEELGYMADTEGGNSGSPVFARSNNKAIGLHHCANCPNRGLRIVDVYNQIQAAAPYLPACTTSDEEGTIELNSDSYGCDSTMTIEVTDGSVPPKGDGSLTIEVWSSTETVHETVTLTETPADSGSFIGTFPTYSGAALHGDGKLSVAHGDTITVQYIDADDGQGGTNIPRQDAATVDCSAPVISNVLATNVTGNSATITWDTNENANSRTTHGTSTPPGTNTDDLTSYVTSHSVLVTGLSQCTSYYFSVTSADPAGNSATANNGGAYYTFTTGMNVNPTYASTDVPKAIPDSTTVTSTVAVTDNKVIQDVNVIIGSLTHTYDGDVEMRILSPGSTTVLLVDNRGSSGDNFTNTVFDDEASGSITAGTAPFTGSFRPEGTLSSFDGQNALGTWTLSVTDTASGDAGTLNAWSINFTYPAQSCGASLEYQSNSFTEACNGTGSGGGNGYIDPGEDVTVQLTLHNNGTSGVTGVTGTLSTSTTGVTVTDATASFPNIAADGTGGSISNHFAFHVDSTVACGTVLDFTIHMASNEGSWDDSFSLTVGNVVPGGTITDFSQNFTGGSPPALPTGWTESHTSGNAWLTSASYYCGAANGLYYPYNSSQAANSYVYTPGIALTAGVTYTLNFNQKIQSATWPENFEVKCGTAATPAGQTITILASAQYTNTTCTLRSPTFTVPTTGTYYISWHCTSAADMYYLIIDDISVTHTSAPSCTVDVCSGGCTNPTEPTIGSVLDNDPDVQDGVTVTFTAGSPSTSNSLLVDTVEMATGITSPYIYNPGDTASHNYVVRTYNTSSCHADSDPVSCTDEEATAVVPDEVASGTNFTWSGQTMNWTADPNATGYRVYRGLLSNLSALCDGDTDFCLRNDGAGTSFDVTGDDPSGVSGRCYYFLITGYSGAGEGPAGTATCGARQINTTGVCP